MRGALQKLALFATCIALLFAARVAFAQVGGGSGPMPRHYPHTPSTPPPSPAGPAHIRVTLEGGERGPLVLQPKNGGFLGEFVVWNDGPGPLTVSRVTTRGDEDDPRLPPHFTARFTDGGGGGTVIQAHSSKRVRVTWIPDREPKLHEALGHVILTSNDEAAGEVAMGFAVPHEGPLGIITEHLLTWLLLLPIFAAVFALAMRIIGDTNEERLRAVVVVTTGLQCLLAILLYEGFNPVVTRVDGNDGFQFVERAVVLHGVGLEYFVGVDGTNVSLVLLTALIGFSVALASYGVNEGRIAYYGCLALLLSGAMGVFVALDACFLALSWAAMLAGLVGLVARGKKGPWPRHTKKVAAYAALSTLFLAAAVALLYAHSNPTYLADGTRVEHTFALPELMRVAYNAKHLTLFGVAWVKVVWTLLFVAFAIVMPLVPLHGWFIDAVTEMPSPVTAVVVGVVMRAGLYGLLRVSVGVLPDGTRWAATTLVAAGVLTLVFGAVRALRQNDLVLLAAYVAIGQVGFCLVGLGGLTREGILGCLLQTTAQGAATAMLFLAIGTLRARGAGTHLDKLADALHGAPLLAASTVIALLATAGFPGLSGFWGAVTSLFGAFPTARAFVALAAIVGALLCGHHVRVVRRALRGGSGTPTAELGGRDLAALVPLLLLAVLLGLYPTPFVRLVGGGVSDTNELVNPPGPDELAMATVESAGFPRRSRS